MRMVTPLCPFEDVQIQTDSDDFLIRGTVFGGGRHSELTSTRMAEQCNYDNGSLPTGELQKFYKHN